jgi:hypothetical protein
MILTSPDGTLWRLHETWRAKLFAAEFRMKQDRNLETKAEYMRVLRTFKDLVMHGKLPGD